jgi:acetyl esterase/lipase
LSKVCAGALALLLAACGRPDPFDDPDYAAACHGLPMRDVEERQAAMENGYTINPRYDCIDRRSWEAVQAAQALVADLVAKAEREAQSQPPAPLAANLTEARKDFTTTVQAPANGTPLPSPPPELFVRSDYAGGEGRKLAAFVSPDPGDGAKHPAIVWLTGGDSSTLDNFWTEGPPQNDQSASAFRKAGMIMMFPTLRGGNTDTGAREFFYGEVDDVRAAAEHLAQLPYVDPARVYLGGHSTGGTLALLVAQSGARFAAVFVLGPVDQVDRYPKSVMGFDLASMNERERQLRSPRHWMGGIQSPTWLIEGTEQPGNLPMLDALCSMTDSEGVVCIRASGFDHFSVIDAVSKKLAARIVVGTGKDGLLMRADEFAAAN